MDSLPNPRPTPKMGLPNARPTPAQRPGNPRPTGWATYPYNPIGLGTPVGHPTLTPRSGR